MQTDEPDIDEREIIPVSDARIPVSDLRVGDTVYDYTADGDCVPWRVFEVSDGLVLARFVAGRVRALEGSFARWRVRFAETDTTRPAE